jgi:hypothetical protein
MRLYERAGFKATGETEQLRPESQLSTQLMELNVAGTSPNNSLERTGER